MPSDVCHDCRHAPTCGQFNGDKGAPVPDQCPEHVTPGHLAEIRIYVNADGGLRGVVGVLVDDAGEPLPILVPRISTLVQIQAVLVQAMALFWQISCRPIGWTTTGPATSLTHPSDGRTDDSVSWPKAEPPTTCSSENWCWIGCDEHRRDDPSPRPLPDHCPWRRQSEGADA